MAWAPEPQLLLEVLELLRHHQTQDGEVQRRLNAGIESLRLAPDGVAYLVTILVSLPQENEDVRQVAGLVLKNHLVSSNGANPQAIEFVKSALLQGLNDSSSTVRSTCGTAITALLTKLGCDGWPEALSTLHQNLLAATSLEVALATLETFKKIVEDELESVKWSEGNAQYSSEFLRRSQEQFLPLLLALARNTGVDQKLKLIALQILQIYNRRHTFAYGEFAHAFFNEFWEALGCAAMDPSAHLVALNGMTTVLEFNSQVIIDNAAAIFDFFIKCSGDSKYEIRLAAINFWFEVLKENTHDQIRHIIPRLLPILLEQTKYSEMDLASLDASQLEDDNAAVPDMSNLNPRFHQPRGIVNEEDTGEDQSTWGSVWTVRKAAGLAIDNFACYFSDLVLPICLPVIDKKLRDVESWEERESGVLILGAISKGSLEKLSNYVPNLLSLLIQLCHDKKPLLRSICCWCLARFAPWYCTDDNAPRYLGDVLMTLLVRMTDRNKSVQEAACSAVAVLEESAESLLTPHLPVMFDCFTSCLQLYQAKNITILYDAIATLAVGVGRALIHAHPQHVSERFLKTLFGVWARASPEQYQCAALCECMGTLTRTLGSDIRPMTPALISKALEITEQELMTLRNESGRHKTDVVESCLDVVSYVCEASETEAVELLRNTRVLDIITMCIADLAFEQDSHLHQAALALVGDLAPNCIELLVPVIPTLLPATASKLNHSLWSVASNASWSLGQLAEYTPESIIVEYTPMIVQNLTQLITKRIGNPALKQNACITLGRFAARFPNQVAPYLGPVLPVWCQIMMEYSGVTEKLKAIRGIMSACTLIPNVAYENITAIRNCTTEFFAPGSSYADPEVETILGEMKQWADYITTCARN